MTQETKQTESRPGGLRPWGIAAVFTGVFWLFFHLGYVIEGVQWDLGALSLGDLLPAALIPLALILGGVWMWRQAGRAERAGQATRPT